MSYRIDPLDTLEPTPVRGTRRGTGQWLPARYDPTAALAQLLAGDARGGPTCAYDPDPDVWTDTPLDRDQAVLLKRVCQRCPVQAPCLEYALAWDSVGVWGGTTGAERRRLRASRRAAAHQVLIEARAAVC